MRHLIPLLSLDTLSLKVLGGSVISKYGLNPDAKTISGSIISSKPQIYLKNEISIGGLSFSQAIPKIDELNHTDILVLYFGTSVGWPRISRKLENHLRPELMTSTAFHLPVYKSVKLTNRLKAKIRHLERNILKLIMFPFGLYRPRHSLEDLPNLIQAIQHIADKKSNLIIWVQHNSLGYRRLWLEQIIYKRYYKEILETLQKFRSPHFRILTPSKEFLVQENFLIDGVHLSELGHARMGKLIAKEIENALNEATEFKKHQIS